MYSAPADAPAHYITRSGIIALQLSAVLLPLGLSYPASFHPRHAPQQAAWEYLSSHYILAHFALLLALTLIVPCLFVLQYYLLRAGSLDCAFTAGILLSILGFTACIPVVAVQGFVLPAYARSYVLGQPPGYPGLAAFGDDIRLWRHCPGGSHSRRAADGPRAVGLRPAHN